jgi:hypothetical protein
MSIQVIIENLNNSCRYIGDNFTERHSPKLGHLAQFAKFHVYNLMFL